METLIAEDKVGKHKYRIILQEVDEFEKIEHGTNNIEYYNPIIRIQRQDSCLWIKYWTNLKSYKCKSKSTINVQTFNARKWLNKHLNEIRNGKF